MMYKFIKATDEKVESQNSVIKNLKIQMSQLATLMSGKIKGALPSNTEKNPKEHLKAISLLLGKTLDDPYVDRQGKPQEVKQVNEGENKRDYELLKEQKDKEKKVQENELMTNPYFVPLPFPQKLKREKLDKQFSKFLEILKQLYINIPFTYALKQMSAYAKFLKEILSSKRKLEEVSVAKLTEKYSDILQNKLPQKLGDPSSFTIPYTLGGAHFKKALCDSGASINLMFFLIFRKLELGEMKDTVVSPQLADQSTKKSKRILENVLVRVDKFIFPVDFIVLEMEENIDVPLILGRTFLATGRAIIDVHQGQLILRVDEERVIFDMQKIIKYLKDESSSFCFQVDLLNDLADEYKDEYLITDSLERCLTNSGTTNDDDITMRKEVEILEKESENEKGKCHFMVTEGIILGHKIAAKRKEVDKAKIDHIAGLPSPTTVKDNCRKAFEILKEYLTNAPIVVSPDWSEPFEIMYDASDIAIGAILGQKRDKIFRLIYYSSRTLNEAQKNCATTEKKLLAVVFAFDKFRSYLIGTKVTSFTHHDDLKYLLAKKDARPRLLRWILLLQEFDLEIKDRRGSENQVTDHLSRLKNPPTETTNIKEEFPDEHVYTIITIVNQPPWFADIANYLVGGWIPKVFSCLNKK
ncbi:uncharacterized protein [Nicotiana tomentosiformis]|uniref:uncharacterized protein n=1 Tax=Nicotiana tomentosiformis TaxID=4098 RepID=UPI00388CE0DF